MPTIKLFICLLCLACLGSNELFKRDLLRNKPKHNHQYKSRFGITEIANNELGVRELSGRNDGHRVETYLAVVKLKKGNPWCAAFVSWVYQQAGFPRPRSGWSPDLFPKSRLIHSALPGDVIGIYFPKLKRIAHVGIAMQQKGSYIYSTEGNTDVQGGGEGDGVYRRVRHIRAIHSIANWYSERKVAP